MLWIRILMFLGLPDPHPVVSHKYGSGSGSFHHQAKIVRKTLISTVLWLLYDVLPMFCIRMFFGLPDPHLDQDRGTDPRIRIRIRIRTKILRIHNTGSSMLWCTGTGYRYRWGLPAESSTLLIVTKMVLNNLSKFRLNSLRKDEEV